VERAALGGRGVYADLAFGEAYGAQMTALADERAPRPGANSEQDRPETKGQDLLELLHNVAEHRDEVDGRSATALASDHRASSSANRPTAGARSRGLAKAARRLAHWVVVGRPEI